MLGVCLANVIRHDHASIATEAKVVAKLKKEGIEKSNLTREEVFAACLGVEKGAPGIILKRFKPSWRVVRLGRTAFTMDELDSESVIKCFVDLYRRPNLSRRAPMVNWDPG